MMQWIKIAGLSAVLAGCVVSAFGNTGQAAVTQGKVFHERLPTTGAGCLSQAWPHIPAECLSPVGEARAPRPVRTITIETREGANTSVLVRVPEGMAVAR